MDRESMTTNLFAALMLASMINPPSGQERARLYLNGVYQREISGYDFSKVWREQNDLPWRTYICTEPAKLKDTPCKNLRINGREDGS